MALTATIHHVHVQLSDVDRSVYETLDLRVAQHPSETVKYLLTRLLAYCLSYDEGIAFSRGGLSSTDEPPVSVHDATGLLKAWIDVGSPSAERLHRAAKAAPKVALYTAADLGLIRKEAATRTIHRIDAIEVWPIEPALLVSLEGVLARTTKLEVVRTDARLYITVGNQIFESPLEETRLL